MDNEVRKVKYSNERSTFDGVFHDWVKKKDEVGNEVMFGLIEGVDGYLEEVRFDYFYFINDLN